SRPGEIAALFASNGLLEIAINKGNASSLLGVRANDPIIIEIKEEG
ncbi:MAG: SAM-dependent chlorinase/fluorinase, partial [Chlorobi bacterium]|nr:SAM-dependent chlorinase/fluorinase [Chlorobiota bacterium]